MNNKRETGLTLVEVLIAMGIATVVGMLLLVIIVNSAGIFTQQSSKVTAGLNINDALLKVRSSIKMANAIASGYVSGSTTFTSGSNQLVLKVASIDSSNNIIEDTFDYFVVFLDQNFLRFKVFPDPLSFRKTEDQILSNIAETLNFQYFNNEIPPVEVNPVSAAKIKITLTLKQKVGATFETNATTTEVNLRND